MSVSVSRVAIGLPSGEIDGVDIIGLIPHSLQSLMKIEGALSQLHP